MTSLTFIFLMLVAVTTAAVVVSDCEGHHCHTTTPDPDKTISLYWMMGDSCFKIGEYNPFLEEKNPDYCPIGTELYWKHPDDMTADEKKAMGIVEADIEELKRDGLL